MTKKRARALASGLIAALAVAFIVASVSQISVTIFGTAPPPAASATPEEAACSTKLRALDAALDRASDRASHAPDEAHAREAFATALAPEWNDEDNAERACESSARSKEAWASLTRLRHGLEGRAKRDGRDIAPLRRDFETRLP